MTNQSSAVLVFLCLLAGCGASADRTDSKTYRSPVGSPPETTQDGTSTAATVDGYKRLLADRIAATNSIRMYTGRPQALLRSIIVIKYQIDADGKLLRSEIMRTNRDRAAEATALASLKAAAPFPKPTPHLLKKGNVTLMESWLFNTDGRFQLRTTAEPQMNE